MNRMLKNTLKLLIAFFIISNISFFTAKSIAEGIDNEQNVNISITPKTQIDIVLSKARSKVNVNNFENDIIEALANCGINSEDVKVQAVNAEQVNLETAFSWQSDVSSSIGSLSLTNNGQNVVMKGNRTNAGKNVIWIEPSGNQEQSFNFNYNIDFGDSFKAAGMLLRVKQTGTNQLSGYMLSFNKSGQDYYTTSGTNGAIWKFTYNGVHTTNMTKTLVKSLSIKQSGTLVVSATDSEIKISGGGLSSTVTCEIDSEYTTGNGFGFFSDHYSHNCEQIGAFTLTGINLTTISTKSFKEVLQLPDWRNAAEKFLINVDDYENEELKDKTAYSELLSKLMNENMHFLSWGNLKNKTQFENLIESNNSKGIYNENTDYDDCIEKTALYIKEVIEKIRNTSSQYVIVNNPININVTPSDITNNTIDSEWPYGKWRIEHDYTYYQNNLGQFAESGRLIDNFITTFNKTGKYQIYYKDSLVYPSEIYVHRKPIARIGITRDENNITLESTSYDLDEYSTKNKGISEEEWKWKTYEETTWTEGKLETINPDKDYLVSLRVKDNQETWSDITTRYITSNLNSPPIACFDLTENTITKYEKLEIDDYSYDPAGGEITKRLWEIYKDGNLIYSGETPKDDFSDADLGEYTIYLTATNNRGLTSDRFGRKFTIIEDEVAPEVIITPTECDWVKSQVVHLEFYDEGSSQVKYYKYAITDSQDAPIEYSDEITRTEDDIEITGQGRKYLHIIAVDNEGNISHDRIAGIYNIDNSGPEIEVSGDFTNEQIEELKINISVTDKWCGLKTIKLDGEIIESGDQILTRNGTYVIESEDIIGNIERKEITVNNIYRKCDKNLGHPDYDINYGTCPICDKFSELQITQTKLTYNGKEQGVGYDIPEGITIVEYYNSEIQKVKDAGEYEYELKVIYDGIEYDTGIKGKIEILPKEITIKNIETEEKDYDATNIVNIINGELVGVEEGDAVIIIMPKTGTAESSEAGDWKVQIDDIILTGERATNYILKQPEYGSIMAKINKIETELEIECPDKIYDKKVPNPSKKSGENTSVVKYKYYKHGEDEELEAPVTVGEYDVQGYQETDTNYLPTISEKVTFKIEPKELTVENIKTEERNYDETDIVNIISGKLVGVEEEDDVEIVIPETGIIEKTGAGIWNVQIDDIVLTGKDVSNYTLKQPEYGEITAKINYAEAKLEIECLDKIYDKKVPEPSKKEGENTSEVKYRYYIHGEDEEIEEPVAVGEYDVQGYQENDENYSSTVSEKVTFKIEPKEITIEGIKVKDKEYDGTKFVKISGGTLRGIIEGDEVHAILPEEAYSESENVGKWNVEIPIIEIEGQDAKNYILKQPDSDNITVNILLKEIEEPIPQTGIENTNLIIICVSALAIVTIGTISFIKYKKVK